MLHIAIAVCCQSTKMLHSPLGQASLQCIIVNVSLRPRSALIIRNYIMAKYNIHRDLQYYVLFCENCLYLVRLLNLSYEVRCTYPVLHYSLTNMWSSWHTQKFCVHVTHHTTFIRKTSSSLQFDLFHAIISG